LGSGNESVGSKSPQVIKRGRGLQVDQEHLKLQTSDDFFDKRKSRKDCRVSRIFRKQIISHIDYLSKSTRLLNLEEIGVDSPEMSVARLPEKLLKARPKPEQVDAKQTDKSKYKVFNTTKIFEGKTPCRKVNSLLRHCVIDKYCDAKSPKAEEQRGLGVNRGHRYQKSQNLPVGGKDFFLSEPKGYNVFGQKESNLDAADVNIGGAEPKENLNKNFWLMSKEKKSLGRFLSPQNFEDRAREYG
jgi:hypothetical protein